MYTHVLKHCNFSGFHLKRNGTKFHVYQIIRYGTGNHHTAWKLKSGDYTYKLFEQYITLQLLILHVFFSL